MIDSLALRRAARWAHHLAAVTLAVGAAAAHAALIEGRTNDGGRYVAGGIGTEEIEALQQEAHRYSLQLITAARTGPYVAGAQVRIVGPGNNVIIDTTVDAPWLLIDLPAGRYTVRATHSGHTVERKLTITPGQPQRAVLHFDVAVDGEPVDPARAQPPR